MWKVKMKRTIVVVLVLGLVAGALSAPALAGKKKRKKKPKRIERVVQIPYQCPCGLSWGQDTPVGPDSGLIGQLRYGYGYTATANKDKFVQAEVVDENGDNVKVYLTQFGEGGEIGSVCGATTEPLRVPSPGHVVGAFVYVGFCDDGTTQSIATTGTIELTFSNLP